MSKIDSNTIYAGVSVSAITFAHKSLVEKQAVIALYTNICSND